MTLVRLIAFAWLLSLGSLAAASGAGPSINASSAQPGHGPELVHDGDDTTSWCPAETPPASGKLMLFGSERFDDWWELDFSAHPETIGAIHMKSGLFKDGVLQGRKTRDFVWAYQTADNPSWQKVPGTDFHGDRYQLIFRFPVLKEVTRLRLLSRTRDPDELAMWGSDYPCLREVAVYPARDAEIAVVPWALAVATWQEGNIYYPLRAPEGTFDVQTVVRQAVHELTGHDAIDVSDDIWIGEFHRARVKREIIVRGKREYRIGNVNVPADRLPVSKGFSQWILHEPAPSYLLFSGNYRNYSDENPSLFSGFYNFMTLNHGTIPSLGACGGHQLTAMALSNPTYEGFATEFAPDDRKQVVVTCSTQFWCGFLGAARCCREDGPPKKMVPNNPDVAMKNPYSSRRFDMLFNLLPGTSRGGFDSYLHHTDSVNPERVSPFFDIIATYPRGVHRLSTKNPTLVQGMKLKGYPVYGTQFHWDESTPWDCKRDEGHRNMERVLKNFVAIGMNKLSDPSRFSVSATGGREALGNLFDLDRSTMWCADALSTDGATLTFEFTSPVELGNALVVAGESEFEAAEQSYEFEYSEDGRDWFSISGEKVSAFQAQRRGALACEGSGGALPGIDDHQTFIVNLEGRISTRFFRIHVRGGSGRHCLRELMLY